MPRSHVVSFFQKVKDKQCLRTVEKFKAVVKDMLKETALDSTSGQTPSLEDTVAADKTQVAETETTDKEMETEGKSFSSHNKNYDYVVLRKGGIFKYILS